MSLPSISQPVYYAVTAIIAIASLAFGAYQYFDKKRSGRSRLKVELSNGALVYGNDLSDAMLFLKAANIGSVPVQLTSQHLMTAHPIYRFRKKMGLMNVSGNVSFPAVVEPGRSCTVWIPLRDLAESIHSNYGTRKRLKITGHYTDAIGNTYGSKKFTIDVKGWLAED